MEVEGHEEVGGGAEGVEEGVIGFGGVDFCQGGNEIGLEDW